MRKRILNLFFAGLLFAPGFLAAQSAGGWQPVEESLTTPWTNKVTPQNVHNKYPRPQMKRNKWQNLNGLWSYKITSSIQDYNGARNKQSNGEILVPFPI